MVTALSIRQFRQQGWLTPFARIRVGAVYDPESPCPLVFQECGREYIYCVLYSVLFCVDSNLQRVVELSKQYLPQLSCGFSDSRVAVHYQDGAEFMTQHMSQFDVIITDSSDPIGMIVHLYCRPHWYSTVDPIGIVVLQTPLV